MLIELMHYILESHNVLTPEISIKKLNGGIAVSSAKTDFEIF